MPLNWDVLALERNLLKRLLSNLLAAVLVATSLVVVPATSASAVSTNITKTFAGSTWTLIAGFHGTSQTTATNATGLKALFTTNQNSTLTSVSSVLALTGANNNYSNSSLWGQTNNGYMLEAYNDDATQRNVVGVLNTANHTWSQLGSSTILSNFAKPYAVTSSQLYNPNGTTIPTTYGYLNTSSGTSSPLTFADDSGDFIMLGVTNQASQGAGDSFDTTFNSATYSIGLGMSDGTGTGYTVANDFTPRGNSPVSTANAGTGAAAHSGNLNTGWILVWVRGAGPIASPTPSITPSNSGKVGVTYTGSDGTWTGTGTVNFVSRKWQISSDNSTWTDISGATSNSYTTVDSDAGKYIRYAVTQSDTNGSTTSASSSSLQITTAPSFTASTPTTTAAVNTAMTSYSFAASGYRITYSIASGALPTGVTLNSSTGALSGTPTASGVFTYTVSASNETGSVTTSAQTLTVNQAPAWVNNSPTLSINTGTPLTYSFTASGYPTPTFSVTSGTLPTGLTLSSGGVLSGTPTTSGTYTATFQASNGIGTAVTVSKTFTVTAGTQAPVVVSSTSTSFNYVVGNTATTAVSASGGSGTGAISYAVAAGSSSVCTVSALGIVTAIAPGTCVVNATKASDINYNAATGSVTITILKAIQSALTVTPALSSFDYAPAATTTISASGGSGTGSISYAVAAGSSSVCNVSGTTVTALTAGACVLTATRAGDSTYLDGTASTTITINLASQPAIAFNVDAPMTYSSSGSVSQSMSATGVLSTGNKTYSVISGNCSVSDATLTATSAGSCEVSLTVAADNKYAATTVSRTITVQASTQGALNLSSSLSSFNYQVDNTASTVISVSGGSGTGALSYSVAAESNSVCEVSALGIVVATSPGICTVEVTKAADQNYLAKSAQISIEVLKAIQEQLTFTSSLNEFAYSPSTFASLSASGGSGSGEVSYQVDQSSTEVCEVTEAKVYALEAGVCLVRAIKQADSTYLAQSADLVITINLADQGNVSFDVARSLTYTRGNVSGVPLTSNGVISSGLQTYSVNSGNCSITGNEVFTTGGGACEIALTINPDNRYAQKTVVRTFQIAKAAQSSITATLADDSAEIIGWQGVKTATFNLAGGSGTGEFAATTTGIVCSVSVVGTLLTVTGLAQGSCEITLTKAADLDFEMASTSFDVAILNLPSAVGTVGVSSTGEITNDGVPVTVTWGAVVASPLNAPVTGYEVQTKNGADWVTISNGIVASTVTSLTMYVTPWTPLFVRVVPISAIDPENTSARNWLSYTGDGNVTQAFSVTGALSLISTSVAAASSGEQVILTGTGFESSATYEVEVSTARNVFASRIGAVALANSKTVQARVISSTELAFNLPVISMPAGLASLATSVRVIRNGAATAPVTFNYIPKKLAQTVTLSTPMPAKTVKLTAGTPLVTQTSLTNASGVPPVVSAGPSNVCSATINSNGKVVVTPIGKGTCSVSIGAPATPGYSAATPKISAYSVNGIAQTITFPSISTKTYSPESFAIIATASSGLITSFTSVTPAVCSVSGRSVTMLKSGSCSIQASQNGDSQYNAAVPVRNTFIISKATRASGFQVAVDSIAADGTRTPNTFTVSNAGNPSSSNVSVVLGENLYDLPLELNDGSGLVTYTVLAADDAAGRCSAGGTDDPEIAAISIMDIGSCKVTISQAADDRYNAGETVVVWVDIIALPSDATDPANPLESLLPTSPADTDNNPADPDSEPAVLVNMDGSAADVQLGGEEGLSYDPTTGKFTFRSKTMLVGIWTVKMTSPTGTAWFKIPGKVVKKVQQFSNAQVCTAKLTVKKDAKLKKRVVRVIGNGCTLNEAGKAAMTGTPVQKVKIGWQRIRQYAKTGLSYVKVKTNRVLKKLKRTIVLQFGQN